MKCTHLPKTFTSLFITICLLFCFFPSNIKAQLPTYETASEEAQEATDSIQFFKGTFKEALEKATTLNMPIFVDAYAQWCGPCKSMANNEFKDKEVANFFNNNFVSIKMDVDSYEGTEFAITYEVGSIPDLVFLFPDGNELTRSVGRKNSCQLLQFGEGALEQFNQKWMVYNSIAQPAKADAVQPNIQEVCNRTPTLFSLERMGKQYQLGFTMPTFLYDFAYELKYHKRPYGKIADEYLAQIKKKELKKGINRQFIYDFSDDITSLSMDYLLEFKVEYDDKFTSDAVNEKIKSAILWAMDKASSTQDETLLNRAIEVTKKANLPDEKEFVHFIQKSYSYFNSFDK